MSGIAKAPLCAMIGQLLLAQPVVAMARHGARSDAPSAGDEIIKAANRRESAKTGRERAGQGD